MPSVLDRILQVKAKQVEAARKRLPLVELERRLTHLPPCRDFPAALRTASPIAVIAEIKKASPSAGLIRAEFDPLAIAQSYQQHGAHALSVLTEEEFFQGSLEILTHVKQHVQLPILRKDFIFDPYQLWEARAAGADAVLLIAECLPGSQLQYLYQQATALGIHVLLELHDAQELPRVLDTGAPVIGINNRDLRTFVTRLEHTLDLLPRIPPDRIVVSESGISTPTDVERLRQAGVRALLIGESLMRASDPGLALQRLLTNATSANASV
jgi:indole-3-glycerol phosphate synthase